MKEMKIAAMSLQYYENIVNPVNNPSYRVECICRRYWFLKFRIATVGVSY